MARFIASSNTSISDPNSSTVGGSFSFYLGSKKTKQDGEIGVFGAEKYFNGGMDGAENPRMTAPTEAATQPSHRRHDRSKALPKNPSSRSESTCDSQSKLLHTPLRKPPRRKSFLPSLRCICYCSEKSPAEMEGPVIHSLFMSPKLMPKEAIKTGATDPFDVTAHWHKEGGEGASMGGFGSPVFDNRGEKALSFGRRRLSLLNSHGDSNDIDCGSDASSDLFEIESLSVSDKLKQESESGAFSGCVTPSACYAPSEVSIEWSVATASAADFSAMSDSEERRNAGRVSPAAARAAPACVGRETQWRRPGILLGSCKSHKAVSVAGAAAAAANAGRANSDRKGCRGPEMLRTVKRFQAEDPMSRQRDRDFAARPNLLYI